uniref:CC chemokine SCYA117 n=1 Tax=Ictalurus punctatus TaxID=7998 RepID=Q20IK3_ICTPU|nr:CC chemokine SCYA117 [Ictalurus punctatus]
MKMNRVVLVLGFVLIMALYSDAQPFAPAHPEDCCFDFFSGKIPPEKILKVKETGSNCREKGFIVTTPKHPSLCVREVPATKNPAAMTEMKHTHTPQ